MGNRPLGTNCGNTNLTRDCCGMIGYQEICGALEYCVAQETAESIRLECQLEWGYVILIIIVIVACIFLYSYRNKINDKFTNMREKRQPRASKSEVKNLLDKGFKL